MISHWGAPRPMASVQFDVGRATRPNKRSPSRPNTAPEQGTPLPAPEGGGVASRAGAPPSRPAASRAHGAARSDLARACKNTSTQLGSTATPHGGAERAERGGGERTAATGRRQRRRTIVGSDRPAAEALPGPCRGQALDMWAKLPRTAQSRTGRPGRASPRRGRGAASARRAAASWWATRRGAAAAAAAKSARPGGQASALQRERRTRAAQSGRIKQPNRVRRGHAFVSAARRPGSVSRPASACLARAELGSARLVCSGAVRGAVPASRPALRDRRRRASATAAALRLLRARCAVSRSSTRLVLVSVAAKLPKLAKHGARSSLVMPFPLPPRLSSGSSFHLPTFYRGV